MKLSIVVATQPASFSALAYKGELETNLEKIAEFGYDGAELAVREPKLLDLVELKRLVSTQGLDVPAIGTGQAFGEEGLSFTDPQETIRESAIQRIKDQIDLAKNFGACVIVGLIRGNPADSATKRRINDWFLQALSECAAYATHKNVRLAMEPINRYETTLLNTVVEGLDAIERVGQDSLGLLLDTFHMNIEEPSISESIRIAGTRIFHFHVADSNRWYPGAGHLDFGSIVEVLGATGYDGYLSAEILPLPDSDTCAKSTIEHMKQIVR